MIFLNPGYRYTLACDRCGTWFPRPFEHGLPGHINHVNVLQAAAREAGWLETPAHQKPPGDLVHLCPPCRNAAM